MGFLSYVNGTADPVLSNLVAEDKVAWYKKSNLRILYFLLLPACIGIEITSGFDAQLINALQFIPPFNKCLFDLIRGSIELTILDFGNGYINHTTQEDDIAPAILGLIKYESPTTCSPPPIVISASNTSIEKYPCNQKANALQL